MQTQYQLSAREYTDRMWAIGVEATGRAMAERSFAWPMLGAFVVLVMGISLNWSDDRVLHGISWLVIALSGLTIAILYNRMSQAVFRSVITEGSIFTKPMTAEIRPEGLSFSNCLGRTELDWDAVQGIEETPEHLTFFVDNMALYLVPKRAFGSREEFEEFFEAAKRWAGLAKGPWSA